MPKTILPAPSIVRYFLVPDSEDESVCIVHGREVYKALGIVVLNYMQMVEIVQGGAEVPGVYFSTS